MGQLKIIGPPGLRKAGMSPSLNESFARRRDAARRFSEF
jgi:hypothetical protein